MSPKFNIGEFVLIPQEDFETYNEIRVQKMDSRLGKITEVKKGPNPFSREKPAIRYRVYMGEGFFMTYQESKLTKHVFNSPEEL